MSRVPAIAEDPSDKTRVGADRIKTIYRVAKPPVPHVSEVSRTVNNCSAAISRKQRG